MPVIGGYFLDGMAGGFKYPPPKDSQGNDSPTESESSE